MEIKFYPISKNMIVTSSIDLVKCQFKRRNATSCYYFM